MTNAKSREPSSIELAILNALLEHDFDGVGELRKQLENIRVYPDCDCGCPTISFDVDPSENASLTVYHNTLIPFEGRVQDDGGEQIDEIILFVRNGFLSSLEYVYYREVPPSEWPPMSRISILRIRN